MWYPKREDVIVPQWAIEVRLCDTLRGRTSSFWGNDVFAVAGIGSAQYLQFLCLHADKGMLNHIVPQWAPGWGPGRSLVWCHGVQRVAARGGPPPLLAAWALPTAM